MLPVSLDTALQPLPAAPLAADLSTVAETRLPSSRRHNPPGARQGARRHRRARARGSHARRPALALDPPSRRHRFRGDDQCRQGAARRTGRHFSLARPEIVSEQVSKRRHAQVAFAHALRAAARRGVEIETVYIPEVGRGTLCVSCQVGCTLNCTFCHTGTQKLVRNLTAAEIVGQFWWPATGSATGRRRRPTDGLVPDAERRLQHRLDGHGRAALQFRQCHATRWTSSPTATAFAVAAADHAVHLGRRAEDRARRRRDRRHARHLAARGQRRPARQAGAAEQEVSDRDLLAGLPRLSRPVQRHAASPSNTSC